MPTKRYKKDLTVFLKRLFADKIMSLASRISTYQLANKGAVFFTLHSLVVKNNNIRLSNHQLQLRVTNNTFPTIAELPVTCNCVMPSANVVSNFLLFNVTFTIPS